MADASRPNILLILTDQHRWDTLGCYGAPVCRTPNLDALAARGVVFDHCYTPTSPCSPARAALFTGLYPHHNHVLKNDDPLNDEAPTLASALGSAGYQLGYAGKWHVDGRSAPSDHGFAGLDFAGYGYPARGGVIEGLRFGQFGQATQRHYADYLQTRGLERPRLLAAHYGDNPGKNDQEMYALHSGGIESSFEALVASETERLLRQFAAQPEQPFFIWSNFWGPHTPCLLPEPYYSLYDPRDIPMEPSFGETWELKPRVHELVERFWGLSAGGWERWREIVARFWGYVTMLDDLVGRIMATLTSLGLADNTLVLFTTDHGDQMGAHRLLEKGPFAYEESWKLPMIAAHPACRAPGSRCAEPVYLHDLFPSLLEAAGLTPPDVADSRSILPQMRGEPAPTGRTSHYGAFAAQLFPFPLRWVRTTRYKLVYNQVDIAELYDLAADPHELRNLIAVADYAAVKAELLAEMRAHMVRLGDPMLGPFDRMRHLL